MHNKRKLRQGGYLAAVTAVVAAIVLLVNLIVGQLPSNLLEFDLSDHQLYTVSDTSVEFLSTLDQDVEIVVLAEEGSVDERIAKFLDRYAALPSHITVTQVDPVAHPSAAKEYDASADSLVVRCAETGNVLLTLECWRDVHPGLVTLPVDWDYSIPYGLLYALDPPEDVRRFVEAVQALDPLEQG